jgi:hypothetical protein
VYDAGWWMALQALLSDGWTSLAARAGAAPPERADSRNGRCSGINGGGDSLAPKHRLAALATEADVGQAIAWAPKHRLVAIATVSLPRHRA